MNARVRTLLVKELRDITRDRRMLAMMLLIPVLLYPVTLVVMGLVMSAGKARLALEELTVAVCTEDAAAFLEQRATPAHTTFVRMSREQGEAGLRDQTVAAVVDAPPGAFEAVKARGQAVVSLVFTKRYDRSVEARDRVRAVLDAVSKGALVTRLEEAQLPANFSEPVKRDEQDLDFQKDLGPYLASRLLPLLMLMMLFVGAMQPAVDLTAGEKERGTLETLLVAPVKPLEVMQAKFIAVGFTAMAAALANLAAMGVTFALGVDLGEGAAISLKLTGAQVVVMLGAFLPAAVMAAGMALAIASLARTFKEGQTLMTSLLMVALLPGLMSMMPGVELNPVTALVPLLNVALLVKAVVLDAAQPLPVALTIIITTGCALISLKLAANAFQSEALRFGAGGVRALFGRERVALPSRSEGKRVEF
ncbi:MAG: ABC transporter permease [Archangiaceae bacterium]|nr:ABC transporter permease [Archangiaceae bacterium]